jgi:thiol:disulfide interchange protein DsbD
MHYSYREGAIGDELEDGDEEPVEVFHDGVIYLASDEGFTVRDNGKAVKDASLLAALEEAREDQEECPLGIHCFHDYDEGIAYARLVDKPVMLDFTGWACVNCRRMEENVWVEPAIKKLLDEEYVLISLYVDEKAELPEDEQYYSCKTERRIRTVGNKWANLQIVNFNKSSQPLYALLSPDEKLLTEPVGYTPKDEYLVFLQSGLSNFRGEELALVE